MAVEFITDFARFESLADAWNEALPPDEVESLWLSSEWLTCWWRAFGGKDKLFIPALFTGDQLQLALPTLLQKRKFKGFNLSTLAFIENGITPRSYLVGHEPTVEKTTELLQALIERQRAWQVAVLDNIKTSSDSYRLILDAATQLGLKVVCEPSRVSPYIDLSDGFEAWFQSLGSRMRRNTRRACRLVSDQGKMEILTVDSLDNVETHLDNCFEVSRKSWKGELGKDLGGLPERAQFYRDFFKAAIKRGWGTLWFLLLDGRPIAFEFHLRRKNKVLLLATDYDQSIKELSPGVALRLPVLEKLAAAGVEHYDFDGTVYEYKLKWTKLVQKHERLWLFNKCLSSRVLFWVKSRLAEKNETVDAE